MLDPHFAIQQDESLRHGLERSVLGSGCHTSDEELLAWIAEHRERVKVEVELTRFSALTQWKLQEGRYQHISGGFFSIAGISVRTSHGGVPEWTQPVIHQPEIGILGIVTANIDGTLHFLMQAKVEPGNLGAVQISPTLQATKSNYTRKHKGAAPAFLDLFQSKTPVRIIDQLQSEQGARFLRKRNRNIILYVEEVPEVPEAFRWMTLAQLRRFLRVDNLINMDTRTVLSALRLTGLAGLQNHPDVGAGLAKFLQSEIGEEALYSMDHLIAWFTDLKTHYELEVKQIPLGEVDEWCLTDERIHHRDHRYFEVLPVSVYIENREVSSWDQPMVRPCTEGICAFFVKSIGGISHLLVQAKVECGCFDTLEMAPTIQCLTGSYKDGNVTFLSTLEHAIQTGEGVLLDVLQSEEGGRFYREQNRNLIIEVGDEFPVHVPDQFMWMTVSQLKHFVRFNNHVNVQARSLLAQL